MNTTTPALLVAALSLLSTVAAAEPAHPKRTSAAGAKVTSADPAPAAAAPHSAAAPAAEPAADTPPTAEPPPPSPPDRRYMLMPMLGYSTDDMNLGLGARVSRMVTDHFSISALFVYQFGKSETVSAPGVVAPGVTMQSYSATTSYSAFYVGPELGYDFDVSPVVLRVYAGLGIAALTTSASAAGVSMSNTDTKFVVWPGASAFYDVPNSQFFVGADVRFVTVPGGPALGAFLLGGMRL